MKTAIKTTEKAGPRRGDQMPSGGRFVGQGATVWVSYGDDADFRQMCADFDRIWGTSRLQSA
jgi:hypothetical protein